MKKTKEYLICTILHAITALLFLVGGIINIVNKGFNSWTDITSIALSVTFASISFMYFKMYKKEK